PLNWLLLLICTVLLAFIGLVIRVDYNAEIPIEKPVAAKESFDLRTLIHKADSADLKNTFPYTEYLSHANVFDIHALMHDLAQLDSFNHNEMGNQELLSIALTTKMQEQIGNTFQSYNPDSLILILQWAEKFDAWSHNDEAHSTLFEVVY